jgi:hypothetical protein
MCTMIDAERELTSVSSRPLCRSYAVAIVDVTLVRLRDAGQRRAHPLFWVFGWLADGECEPLGACVGVHALPRMLDGLRNRGIQRISRMAALDVEDVEDTEDAERARFAMACAFPQALASSRSDSSPAVFSVAAEVRETVIRAIRRHRLFDDEAHALDIASLALQRVERRLDSERRMAA